MEDRDFFNVELRMWNFELVALRAMKNFPINNY